MGNLMQGHCRCCGQIIVVYLPKSTLFNWGFCGVSGSTPEGCLEREQKEVEMGEVEAGKNYAERRRFFHVDSRRLGQSVSCPRCQREEKASAVFKGIIKKLTEQNFSCLECQEKGKASDFLNSLVVASKF